MTGGRKETVDDSEILEMFVTADDPILFTGELADEFDFSNQGMIKRLRSLEQDGYLSVKRSGNVPAWWITEKGEATLDS